MSVQLKLGSVSSGWDANLLPHNNDFFHPSHASRLHKVQYNVGVAMRNRPYLRRHCNREKLYQTVKGMTTNQSVSMESVLRAQRKLWSMGLYIPGLEEGKLMDIGLFTEWLSLRRICFDEFKTFALSEWGYNI